MAAVSIVKKTGIKNVLLSRNHCPMLQVITKLSLKIILYRKTHFSNERFFKIKRTLYSLVKMNWKCYCRADTMYIQGNSVVAGGGTLISSVRHILSTN